ncbi:thioredoxin family protein [Pseudanabaena sp. FACHB-1998]|uniref:thioredoxin family protein n=1 Tax=Pseudanabaena sp. FACHB-1998 TaxID=2692858 RepID=UPI0016819F8C|nr:thioredoxin family protein [Pseudanabaena sp. FACHB-1998]MBD2176986.1 thioredoxin family protein [Pseudanabaena sp. FACHB-1998]
MSNSLLRRRRLLIYAGLGALGIGSAAIATQLGASKITANKPKLETRKPLTNLAQPLVTEANLPKLPEFQGIAQWLNSPPLMTGNLVGNVVLIQFWTFSCINCQRTLPYVTRWHEQYGAKGLKIIGVHTPEFAFERDINNIKDAMQRYRINYTVAVDNEFKTWKAYGNEYWPHLYLADRQGNLRYDHIGEGAYDRTEKTIQQLLG